MPSLGADMQSGKLLEWKVAPGTLVKRGQVVAVVGTEKGDIEVEVFEEGIIHDFAVQEGAEVPVGAPLAWIDESAAHPGLHERGEMPVPPPQSKRPNSASGSRHWLANWPPSWVST